jgi:hypothetical protein
MATLMTLNYEPEGEPPEEGLGASLPQVRLVVGLGKTHGPALVKDACPCLGAVTRYAHLSDRTIA